MQFKSASRQAWSILDHLDQLNILNDQLSSEYVCECPVCNGHRLTISKTTGAYSCWTTECPSSEIRAAVGGPEARYSHLLPTKKLQPARINEEIELARLPTDAPIADLNNETWYDYGNSCRVHRYYEDDEKFTIPYCNGSRGKGDHMWLPYRSNEMAFSRDRWLLVVEGEKCVEYARSLGLIAITWQGSSWTFPNFMMTIIMLRSAGVRGIVYWPDYDIPGFRKAEKLWYVCAQPLLPKHKFKLVVLDPRRIWATPTAPSSQWSDVQEGQDIADWVQAGAADVEQLQAVANSMKSVEFKPTIDNQYPLS